MKKEYPSDFTEPQKDWYDNLFKQVLELPCEKCGKKTLEKVSLWVVQCTSCKQLYGVYRPKILKKGLANSNNWKATCEECGGIMDYYNLKYCCRKCGHILEV